MKSVQLFTFIREFAKLSLKPAESLDGYIKTFWLDQIPHEPECSLAAWVETGIDEEEMTIEDWLTVERPERPDTPPVIVHRKHSLLSVLRSPPPKEVTSYRDRYGAAILLADFPAHALTFYVPISKRIHFLGEEHRNYRSEPPCDAQYHFPPPLHFRFELAPLRTSTEPCQLEEYPLTRFRPNVPASDPSTLL